MADMSRLRDKDPFEARAAFQIELSQPYDERHGFGRVRHDEPSSD